MCGNHSVAWTPVGEGFMTTPSSAPETQVSGQGRHQPARLPQGDHPDPPRDIPLGPPPAGPWVSTNGPPGRSCPPEQCSSYPDPDDDDLLDDDDDDDAFEDDEGPDDETDD